MVALLGLVVDGGKGMAAQQAAHAEAEQAARAGAGRALGGWPPFRTVRGGSTGGHQRGGGLHRASGAPGHRDGLERHRDRCRQVLDADRCVGADRHLIDADLGLGLCRRPSWRYEGGLMTPLRSLGIAIDIHGRTGGAVGCTPRGTGRRRTCGAAGGRGITDPERRPPSPHRRRPFRAWVRRTGRHVLAGTRIARPCLVELGLDARVCGDRASVVDDGTNLAPPSGKPNHAGCRCVPCRHVAGMHVHGADASSVDDACDRAAPYR